LNKTDIHNNFVLTKYAQLNTKTFEHSKQSKILWIKFCPACEMTSCESEQVTTW